MDTSRAKQSPTMKLVLAGVGLFAISFLGYIGWLCYQDIGSITASPRKLAAESSAITLARADKNAPAGNFVVVEIWKQPASSSAPSLRVGAHVRLFWPKDGRTLPDEAIIFYQRSLRLTDPFRLEPWTSRAVRSGQVEGGTIREFKIACGL
jgi:hypothetical protein